jgi:hypothetical protein
MPQYRCYFIDSEDHIRGVEALMEPNDTEAVVAALRLFTERNYYPGFEVWQGKRRLSCGEREGLGHHHG